MNTIRFTSKEAFVEALEGRRKFWRAFDTEQFQQHVAAEKAWLQTARAKMREAIKWDYATLKEAVDWNQRLELAGKAPECPVLHESRIDEVLRALALTQGQVFTVDSGGTWAAAHSLLTDDPRARKTAC